MSDDPPEIFTLDFIHSGGMLDFRPRPVSPDQPDPNEEVIDPKASSALESAESLKSTETTTESVANESSASEGPFASAEKDSSPFKEDEVSGSPTS
jgi:hypothetical protein